MQNKHQVSLLHQYLTHQLRVQGEKETQWSSKPDPVAGLICLFVLDLKKRGKVNAFKIVFI